MSKASGNLKSLWQPGCKLAVHCLWLLSVLWPLRAAQVPRESGALSSRVFTLAKESEVGLEIEARSPGASWATKGAEAAALLIEVDGQYNQDLILWAGDTAFVYRVMLGRLGSGKHRVTLRHNQAA